jgi:hypothetical protein
MKRRILRWSVASLLLGAVGLYVVVWFGPLSYAIAAVWVLLAGRSVSSAMEPRASLQVRVAAAVGMGLWTLALLAAGLAGLFWLFSLSCDPGQYECPI